MISPELVERMKDWRHSGFHAFASEEIPDIEDVLRVGLYMVRGPAATSRLHADPDQNPKVRYLAKGAVPDHGEERVSSGHRDDDYLERIARLTSHIPDRGTQLVHYYGAYSTDDSMPGATASCRACTRNPGLPPILREVYRRREGAG